jgi:hypothetical protein
LLNIAEREIQTHNSLLNIPIHIDTTDRDEWEKDINNTHNIVASYTKYTHVILYEHPLPPGILTIHSPHPHAHT